MLFADISDFSAVRWKNFIKSGLKSDVGIKLAGWQSERTFPSVEVV
ncbi:Uncharacterized protein dnm_076810 [Desulfonema magnum]|uniref:Uncharacterized protein n=1 Tax=Desulfonema magnum TaxID=45655 RepID=A0A975BTT1_9BACT|nr:Uncharacterized protein dnm_076810 [Desulfonema magnum]